MFVAGFDSFGLVLWASTVKHSVDVVPKTLRLAPGDQLMVSGEFVRINGFLMYDIYGIVLTNDATFSSTKIGFVLSIHQATGQPIHAFGMTIDTMYTALSTSNLDLILLAKSGGFLTVFSNFRVNYFSTIDAGVLPGVILGSFNRMNQEGTSTAIESTSTLQKTVSARQTSLDGPGNGTSSVNNADISAIELTVIIGSVAVLMGIIVIMARWIFRRHRRTLMTKNRSVVSLNGLAQNLNGGLNGSQGSLLHGPHTYSGLTLATNHELSIPVFLEREWDVDFKKGSFVGRGGDGIVYKFMASMAMSHKLVEFAAGQKLIVKVMKKPLQDLGMTKKRAFWTELSLMWKFRDCPYTAKVFGFSTSPLCLIVKYYQYGDLAHFIAKRGPAASEFKYNKWHVVNLLKQLCSGIGFMHQNGFVHCDIKPSNTLFDISPDNSLVAIVSDFGICRLVDFDSAGNIVDSFPLSEMRGVSFQYAAPEVFRRLKPNFAQERLNPTIWRGGDVFALAMTLLEMLQRKWPWKK